MYPPYFVMPIFGIRVGVHHHVGSFCAPAATHSGGKERQGLYMRKFKTAEKNRTNYVYYTAKGKKVKLKPGQEGIDETWIAILHDWDDKELDAERREKYHTHMHFGDECDWLQRSSNTPTNNGQEELPRMDSSYLEGKEYAINPLDRMLAFIDEQEHSDKLTRLKVALSTLTDLQRDTIYKKFYRNMTNVQIAAEEKVSEAAIRNRLKKIYATLRKKI